MMDALNAAYRERAHLVALLAAVYPSHVGRTDPNAPGWAVVTLQLPTGQTAWHIAPDDETLFQHVEQEPENAIPWDGHSTEEKYRRIDELTTRLAEAAEPDPDVMAVPRFEVEQLERDERDARIAELEREVRNLRGTDMNPSPMVLDAQAYGELRDEIAATMGDGWDLDEAEISILIKYVRWLAAGQPRDEDGYPVRRDTYPAAEFKPDVCVCGDPNCMPYWRPVHEQMNTMRLKADMANADFTKAMLAEIFELQAEVDRLKAECEAAPDEQDAKPGPYQLRDLTDDEARVLRARYGASEAAWDERDGDSASTRVREFVDAWSYDQGADSVVQGGNADIPYLHADDLTAILENREMWRNLALSRSRERDGDVRADAFNLDCEELVEIFADFIGQWDRSHEVITVGLPDHLPQLRIPHLRRAVVALQRLGRERDAAFEVRDSDVRAVAALAAAVRTGSRSWGETDALIARFADRIAALDARDKPAAGQDRADDGFAWHELHYGLGPDPLGPEPESRYYQLFHAEQCLTLPTGAVCWANYEPHRHWWPAEDGVYRIRPVEMSGGGTEDGPNEPTLTMEIQVRAGEEWADYNGPCVVDLDARDAKGGER